eukprot:scaffold4470_cov255-Prasinococcus_capsulatus_cf.AAC.35
MRWCGPSRKQAVELHSVDAGEGGPKGTADRAKPCSIRRRRKVGVWLGAGPYCAPAQLDAGARPLLLVFLVQHQLGRKLEGAVDDERVFLGLSGLPRATRPLSSRELAVPCHVAAAQRIGHSSERRGAN